MTHQDQGPINDAGDGQVIEAKDTRQASPGRRIVWILVLSAAAAAILLLGMWAVSNGGFASQNANDGDQAVDAAAFAGDAETPPRADPPTTPEGEPTNPPTGQAPNVNAPLQ